MNIQRIIVVATVLCMATILNAQAPDFSGVWVLKNKISLSGVDYGNGVAKQMEIKRSKDSIFINRVYEGGNGDYTITELLSLDGSTTSVVHSNSKRISSFIAGNDSLFSIMVSYEDVSTGKQTSANFIELWKFENRNELEIMKNATDPNGDKWSMKGIYELKTKEEAAYEQATGKGIQFTQDLTWDEIKEKAKRENKYVFIDCFATWCGPCKKMEKEVFDLNMVGDKLNDKFICVRVQMDTTGSDNDIVKKWYATAHKFLNEYNITGYPTFLFFDADGNVLHKALGYYEANDFLGVVNNALDPSKQYYTLLNNYDLGKEDASTMGYLASAATRLNEKKVAEKVIRNYKKSYLDHLPSDSLLSEKYLKLASEFPLILINESGSKGNFFKLFYNKGSEVDGILNAKGFSSFYVNVIITREEINERIYIKEEPVKNPDWQKITTTIKRKYAKSDAEKLVLKAQTAYYQRIKDWNNQIKYIVEEAEKYGPLSLGDADGSGSDNVLANALLPHCDDKQILNKAVGWMEQIIHSNAYKYPIPMIYGNYGGILYKVGRREEGIAAFEKHLNAIGYKNPEDIDKDPRYKPKVNILNKMKRGEKIDSTWSSYDFN